MALASYTCEIVVYWLGEYTGGYGRRIIEGSIQKCVIHVEKNLSSRKNTHCIESHYSLKVMLQYFIPLQ